MMRIAFFIVVVLLCTAPIASAAAKVYTERITSANTPWVASTWGYSTPKLLCDGKRLYAMALVGTGIDHDTARLYWRDLNSTGKEEWNRGADLSPIYQPGTILLDERGHIEVFTTERFTRLHHWRSVKPGDVTRFDPVEMPSPEKFAYGYLGVGRSGAISALAGLDSGYTMWITARRGSDAAWIEPVKLVEGQKATQPWTSATYPIVLPTEDGVDVIYSNSPDGGVHNTYDRVEAAHFDLASRTVTARAVVARGIVGDMTFGLDALRSRDGSLAVLYMTGLHVYGQDMKSDKGLFLARSKDGVHWNAEKVCASTGTAQLHERADGSLEVLQSTSEGTIRYRRHDDGKWTADAIPLWTIPGAFLQVMKPQSGSVIDAKLVRAMQSVPLEDSPPNAKRYGLEYLEAIETK